MSKYHIVFVLEVYDCELRLSLSSIRDLSLLDYHHDIILWFPATTCQKMMCIRIHYINCICYPTYRRSNISNPLPLLNSPLNKKIPHQKKLAFSEFCNIQKFKYLIFPRTLETTCNYLGLDLYRKRMSWIRLQIK